MFSEFCDFCLRKCPANFAAGPVVTLLLQLRVKKSAMSAHLMQRGLLRLRPGLLLRAAANAANAAGRTGPKWSHVRTMASAKGNPQEDYWPIKVQIGKREVVGFGSNGEEVYLDDVHHPFPAIRFKEDTGEIAVRKRHLQGQKLGTMFLIASTALFPLGILSHNHKDVTQIAKVENV